LNLVGRQAGTTMAPPSQLASRPGDVSVARMRRAYFGPDTGWLTVPVVRRADLAGGRNGPLIVEEYDATCLVPGHAFATLGADGSIVMQIHSGEPPNTPASQAESGP
jgi:N-methylhydantoinase A